MGDDLRAAPKNKTINKERINRMNTKMQPNRTSRSLTLLTAVGLVMASSLPSAHADAAAVVADAIWANDALYGTIGTDTSFTAPPEGTTDVLFNFGDSGLSGQRAVSEAAPGDPDYNGGRWNVMLVTFTELGMTIHDADGDGMVDFELTNAEAVLHHAELGHLTITAPGVYFECPLRPQPRR